MPIDPSSDLVSLAEAARILDTPSVNAASLALRRAGIRAGYPRHAVEDLHRPGRGARTDLRPATPRPGRVVDRHQRGWLTATDPIGTHPRVDTGEVWTWQRLRAERGPLRPVVAVPAEDVDLLHRVLAQAGRRALPSVLSALAALTRKCHEADGHDGRLVAGRPGSWESALLPRLARDVGAGIALGRVDDAATVTVVRTVTGWIFDPDRYVEVAENLALVLGRLVDGRGGWEQVTDRWLLAHPLEEEVRGWATSTSRWHQPLAD